MEKKDEEIEDLTPTPWLYWCVCGIVVLLCVGFFWFLHDVYAHAGHKQTLSKEVSILMPAKERDAVIEKKEQDVSVQFAVKTGEKIPLMAIVIDDMGINQKRTKDILSLQAPLTSSFLTYGKNLKELCMEAQNAGHEIIIHVPMEPEGKANLAPDTLTMQMTDEEIEAGLKQMLQKFEGIDLKGANNHMGSLFTMSAPKMDAVMNVLKSNNMFFLDSKTTPHSVAGQLAEKNGVRYLKRDVFLDNKNDYDYISKQLKEAEKIAQLQGYSIAIGHPKSQTFRALKEWLEKGKNKKIRLVHISELPLHKDSKE